jgi:hypothetical protein
MSSKSQSSLEFLVLAGFMFLFFVGFAAVAGTKIIDFQEILKTRQVQDIMEVVKTEIQLAVTSMDGYKRNFYLPESIEGRNYTMGIIDDSLVLLYDGKRYEYSLPGEAGTIKYPETTIYKGKNTIMKSDGEILILSSDPCQWLDKGANSYCLGGTCYCDPGSYDTQCDDTKDEDGDGIRDNDGIFEDDFIVHHCGNLSKGDEYMGQIILPIDCIAVVDPCNKPPIFISGPSLVGSATERGASIYFESSDPLIRAIVSYTTVIDTASCTNSLDFSDSQTFPLSDSKSATVTLEGLVPSRTYCFRVEIFDKKEGSKLSTAGPSTTFTTTEDTVAPLITNIFITPELGYLATEFTVTAKIDEPSDLYAAELMINSTLNEQIKKYVLDDDMVYDSATGTLTLHFTVEDPLGTGFMDHNSSTSYDPLSMLFYNRFDNPISFDADWAVNPSATAQGTPEHIKGRFSDAVKISAGDKLSYLITGNMNLNKGTIEFWTKTPWAGDSIIPHYFFQEGAGGDTDPRMTIFQSSDNNLYFSVHYPSGDTKAASLPLDSSPFMWDEGSFYFIAATWDFDNIDPSRREIVLYINGTQKNVVSSVPALPALSDHFVIGGSSYQSGYEADAVIDHFVIFNDIRTQDQIKLDMIRSKQYLIDLSLKDASDQENSKYYDNLKTFTIKYSEKP